MSIYGWTTLLAVIGFYRVMRTDQGRVGSFVVGVLLGVLWFPLLLALFIIMIIKPRMISMRATLDPQPSDEALNAATGALLAHLQRPDTTVPRHSKDDEQIIRDLIGPADSS